MRGGLQYDAYKGAAAEGCAGMQAEVGQQLGRFKLLDILGSGGFATVFRAEDTQLGSLVAVKVLHPHLAANREFVNRFYAEARSAARLRGHAHIVTIYDVATTADGRPYLIMSLVQGMPLSQLLAEH
jgi:serine/threonine protein kinase